MSDPAAPALFRLHAARRAAGNFALLRHRACHGYLLSMHQSGTHWLKFMLANALADHHHLPPPRYNHANDYIGGPRDAVIHPGLPRLLSSHSMPHPLLRWRAVHAGLALPRYVVLVRDIRQTLISNWMKWRERYGVSFSEYVLGDPRGRRYNSDLWWAIRFLNAWGEIAASVPERVTIVRYEDLVADTPHELARVAAALALDLPPSALAYGLASASKAAMAARHDPARPPGAVRRSADEEEPDFSAADRVFLSRACARHLRHAFGYDYTRWPAD